MVQNRHAIRRIQSGLGIKLYFVVDTKGGLFDDAIKLTERAKIACGKKYFAAIDTEVKFELVDTFDTLQGKITS